MIWFKRRNECQRINHADQERYRDASIRKRRVGHHCESGGAVGRCRKSPCSAPRRTDRGVRNEHARLQHASNLAQYEASNATALELLKSVVTTAGVAIKSLILINGGAAVALLAFIGHLATSGTNTGAPVHAFAVPLLWFVIGVWTAALFAGFVAAAQKLYAEEFNQRTFSKDARYARRLRRCANVCVLVDCFWTVLISRVRQR